MHIDPQTQSFVNGRHLTDDDGTPAGSDVYGRLAVMCMGPLPAGCDAGSDLYGRVAGRVMAGSHTNEWEQQ